MVKQFYDAFVLPQLQKMDGCRMASLIKSHSAKGVFISLTLWDEKNQAEKYEKSEAYKNLMAQIKDFLSESSEWKIQLSEDYKLEYKPTYQAPIKDNYAVAVKTNNSGSSPKQPAGMYIRIVSLKIQPDKIDEFKEIYSREIIPALESTRGCSVAYLTESLKNTNEFLSISLWENKEFAEEYEASGKFEELTAKIRYTFSKFYLWKTELEEKTKGKVETSEDMKIDKYTAITGKSFE
jgi:quinol monooxygenase YgiN